MVMKHENPGVVGGSDAEPSNLDKQSESDNFKTPAELEAMMSQSQRDFLGNIESSELTPDQKFKIRQRELDTLMPPEQRQALEDAQEWAQARQEALTDEYGQSHQVLVARQLRESEQIWSRINPPMTTARDIEIDRQTLNAKHLLESSQLQDWFHTEQDAIYNARDSMIVGIRGVAPPEFQQAA